MSATTTTTTPAPPTGVSLAGESDVPKSVIALSMLGGAIIIGLLISRLVDICYSRAEIDDTASDISDEGREIIKLHLQLIKNMKNLEERKKQTKEEQLKVAEKMMQLWISKLLLKIQGEEEEEEEEEREMEEDVNDYDKTAGKLHKTEIRIEIETASNYDVKSRPTSPQTETNKLRRSSNVSTRKASISGGSKPKRMMKDLMAREIIAQYATTPTPKTLPTQIIASRTEKMPEITMKPLPTLPVAPTLKKSSSSSHQKNQNSELTPVQDS